MNDEFNDKMVVTLFRCNHFISNIFPSQDEIPGPLQGHDMCSKNQVGDEQGTPSNDEMVINPMKCKGFPP
jgi:hypothetical protein